MRIPKPLEYLDSEHINYEIIDHPRTFTARSTAQSAHLTSQTVSKVVIVKADQRLVMVVIPADANIEHLSLARELGVGFVMIASEEEFRDRFPNCEIGAMPPLGNLYGMEVFIAKELYDRFDITFNGGTHTQLIRMNTVEFCDVTRAKVIEKGYKTTRLTIPVHQKQQKPWHWI